MRSVCSPKSGIRILLDFFRDGCTAPMKLIKMIRKNSRVGGGGLGEGAEGANTAYYGQCENDYQQCESVKSTIMPFTYHSRF